MDEKRVFSCLVMQFVIACNLCTMTYIMGADGGLWLYPQILLVYGPAVYGIDSLFLRRQRTMRGLVVLNVLMGAGLALTCWLAGDWSNFGELAFMVAFCVWLTAEGGHLALSAPNLRGMILCLDVSVVTLVLFTGYTSALGIRLLWSAPILAGTAAALLGIITHRISRPPGLKGWSLLSVAFGGIFAGMWLLVGFVAAPAGHGIVALWNGLTTAVMMVLRAIWRFLVFLASLLPDAEPGEMGPMEAVELPLREAAETENSPVIAAAAAVAGVALVLAGLVWLLYQLGKLNIGGKKKMAARAAPRRRRLSLWKGLGRLLAAWGRRLRLRVYLWKGQNTPQGLYFLLVYRCRIGPWHKRTGETPREFLTRLRGCAQGDGELVQALEGLIPQVDAALYGQGGEEGDVRQAGLIRRRIGAAVRRQFFRDCRDQARQLKQTLLPHK